MILRLLFAILIEWPAMLIATGLFVLAGLVVVPLGIYFEAFALLPSKRFGDYRRVLNWRSRWMFPWGNDEDGINGIPLLYGVPFKNQRWIAHTYGWRSWRRIFVWAALRNSASNLRFMPVLGYKINPSELKAFVFSHGWFVWEGWRSNLYLEYKGVHFWIGWPQKPWDLDDMNTLPDEDTRAPGVSFKLQIRRNR